MKKILTLGLVLLTFGAMAQQKPHRGEMRKAHSELSPEQRATLQSKKMALALELDTRQQNQVASLLKQRFEKRDEVRANRQAKAGDSTKRPSPEERYNRMNSRLDQELAFQGEMKKILTESQFEKWRKMHGTKKRMHQKSQKQKRQRKRMHKQEKQ